jgi:transcriptional antiterminator RfaH
MSFWEERNWFVIQTKPRQEDVAAIYLGGLTPEILLPKIEQEQLVYGVPKQLLKPLFPNYLFARFEPSSCLPLIRYARGVRRVLSAGGAPLPVDESIIQAIQARVGPDGTVRLDTETLTPNTPVMVNEGPLKGFTGIFRHELKAKQRVMILLEAIGFTGRVVVEKRYVKPLDSQRKGKRENE